MDFKGKNHVGPLYIDVDGLRIRSIELGQLIRDTRQFKPDKNDILVVPYLKCGTTWMTQIVSLILRKGKPHSSSLEYFSSIPFVEFADKEKLDELPRPRCLKTHLTPDLMQFRKDSKYIWVLRHPADCLVSLYHHIRFIPSYRYTDGSLDDFFELFLKGEVDYMGYFDHMLSWYEYRNEPNVLCITYESMKKDTRGSILKIARHMGEEYYNSLLQNNEELLKKVLYYSSFDYMKSAVNGFWNEAYFEPPPQLLEANPLLRNNQEIYADAVKSGHSSIGQFIRKGVSGDGKATLSEEQMKRLIERCREKFGHTDIMKLLRIEQ